ncbi:hypothetical protein Clacol_005950 [Clathrus columnatus]|uniref:Cytochrome P450 n=1 Tax=Clathrus columnatus TaxID=1419009 RepID=A0AAV5AGB2_9AGAM|nr:hypothetical protein Clacol_005950 [Clathrus columnatus]
MVSLLTLLSGASILAIARLLYGRLWPRSIDKVPGPPPVRWLTGNLPELLRSDEISDAPFKWLKEYGAVVKLHAEFGRKILYVADPKALYYILNTSGYNFPKTAAGRAGSGILLGKGLFWAEGSQHAQQRKIVTPAFSFNTLRDFIPIFLQKTQKTVNKLREQIESAGNPESNVINMLPWLSRTTLDIIGVSLPSLFIIAAAEYDFEAIDGGQDNRADAFYKRSDGDIAVAYVLGNAPGPIQGLMKRLPTRSLKKIGNYMTIVRKVAQEVVDKQTALYTHGKEGSKDLMSVLIRANLSENTTTKLTNEEVISKLTTFFFAGHEPASSTLIWALYELARHPEYQKKVRDEIKTTRARAAEKNDGEITISDLDSMQYLSALIKMYRAHNSQKETLRFHPVTPTALRQAGQDDHLPLDTPLKLTTGEVITSLPVECGQHVLLSFMNYNRLTTVWGEDADEWRPERFFEEHDKDQTRVGVISNMMLEMEAILFELVEHFEFSPPPGNIEILRVAAGVMAPMYVPFFKNSLICH